MDAHVIAFCDVVCIAALQVRSVVILLECCRSNNVAMWILPDAAPFTLYSISLVLLV